MNTALLQSAEVHESIPIQQWQPYTKKCDIGFIAIRVRWVYIFLPGETTGVSVGVLAIDYSRYAT